MKKAISANNIPEAIGPYSPAVRIGDTVYTSGQIPLTPNGEFRNNNVQEAVDTIMENISNILKSQDMGFQNVVKTTVYATSMEIFPEFNEHYSKYFEPPYPARSFIVVKELPKGSILEIEAVAILP